MNLQEQQSSAFKIYDFQLFDVVNENHLGTTYRAMEQTSKTQVAVQILNPNINNSPALIEALDYYVSRIKALDHTNIQRILSLEKGSAGCILVKEYVEGWTLESYLLNKGILDWQSALRFIKQMLSGLSYAHRSGYVHRSLSPQSILITRGNSAKIADIGLNKIFKEHEFVNTEEWNQSETHLYAAPESITNDFATANEASDIYSIGLIAHMMLTGTNPIKESNPNYFVQEKLSVHNINPLHLVNSLIPEPLSIFITQATENHAIHRFQTASAMLEALEELTTVSHSPNVVYHRRSGARRLSFRIPIRTMLALGCLCALCSVGYYFLQQQKQNPFEALSGFSADPLPSEYPEAATLPTSDQPASDSLKEAVDDETQRATEPVPPLNEAAPSLMEERLSPARPIQYHTHTLVVKSRPSGASVSINGKELGRTPFQLTNIQSESAEVGLSLAGHQTLSKQVQLEEDKTTEAFFTLRPTNRQLVLTIFPWGNIYLDGQLVAERVSGTDTLDISPDKQTLSVVHPAFGNWEKLLSQHPDNELSFIVDFRVRSSIRVVALDEAQRGVNGEVFINGKSTNRVTPLTIELPLGEHSIEVRAAGFEPSQLTTMIDEMQRQSEPLTLLLKRKTDVN